MLPAEIWEEIASHLNNSDYHILRSSSKNIRLRIDQRMQKSIFKSTVMLNDDLDGKIHVQYKGDDDIVYFLCFSLHFKELLRILPVISTSALNSAFWYLAIQLEKQIVNPIEKPFQIFIHQGHFQIEDFEVTNGLTNMIKTMLDYVSIPNQDLLFHLAILSGHVFIFESLVHLIVDHYAILWISCRFGYLKIVEILLINNQVDPSIHFHSAFITACKYGYHDIISRLLEHPNIKPFANENEGIAKAAAYGHVSIVELLLGIPTVDPASHESTALVRAVIGKHFECVKLLLLDGRVDPSAEGNIVIRELVDAGEIELLELVLQDARVRATADLVSVIYRACTVSSQNIEIVKRLLQCPEAEVDINGNEFLLEAATQGNYQIALYLLENIDIDPFYCGGHVFVCACEDGNIPLIEYYFGLPNFDPTFQNNLALTKACANGHLNVVEMLLGDGRVNPMATSNYTFSRQQYFKPAFITERQLDHHSIFMLHSGYEYRVQSPDDVQIEYKITMNQGQEQVSVHVVDDYDEVVYQNTALRVAIQNGHVDIVKRLLGYPDMDLMQNENEAILTAIEYEQFEIAMEILVRIDPTVPNNMVLRLACFFDCPKMIEMVLKDGRVDPTAFDNQALLIACQSGWTRIVSLLLADARINPTQSIPIYLSALEGKSKDLVQLLIKSVPVTDLVLEYAIIWNLDEIFLLLFTNCTVETDVIDRWLMLAITCGNSQMVDRILPRTTHIEPCIALSIAFKYDMFDIIKILMKDDRFKGYLIPLEKSLVEYQYHYSLI